MRLDILVDGVDRHLAGSGEANTAYPKMTNGTTAEDFDIAFLSDSTYYALYAVCTLSCFLSIFGSLSICYLVVKTKRLGELYHQLVLSLSVSDIFQTLSMGMQAFALPADTGLPLAKGNKATCRASAFLLHFFLTSYFYSCCLSIFYLCVVRYGMTEAKVHKRMGNWIHVVAYGLPLLLNSIAVWKGAFNPHPFFGICIAYDFDPVSCVENADANCYEEEGSGELLTYLIPLIAISFHAVSLLCVWLVWWTVYQRQRRSKRQVLSPEVRGDMPEQTASRFSLWNRTNHCRRDSSVSSLDRRVRAVAVQALCYAAVYSYVMVITMTSFLAENIMFARNGDYSSLDGNPAYAVYIFFSCLVLPLQGFMNWFIYIRPRLVRWKDGHPGRSWFWAYRQVWKGLPPPTTIQTAHLVDLPARGHASLAPRRETFGEARTPKADEEHENSSRRLADPNDCE